MSKMLSSWKEIAHFFGKGVRTVQRWEKTLDLPIHRPPGAPSNVVLARTSDLEEWMHSGPASRVGTTMDGAAKADKMGDVLTELEQEIHELSASIGVSNIAGYSTGSPEQRLATLTAQIVSINAKIYNKQPARAA